MSKFLGFIYWLLGFFWDNLDDETKKKIIEAIINKFEEVLRHFYEWSKKRQENKS